VSPPRRICRERRGHAATSSSANMTNRSQQGHACQWQECRGSTATDRTRPDDPGTHAPGGRGSCRTKQPGRGHLIWAPSLLLFDPPVITLAPSTICIFPRCQFSDEVASHDQRCQSPVVFGKCSRSLVGHSGTQISKRFFESVAHRRVERRQNRLNHRFQRFPLLCKHKGLSCAAALPPSAIAT